MSKPFIGEDVSLETKAWSGVRLKSCKDLRSYSCVGTLVPNVTVPALGRHVWGVCHTKISVAIGYRRRTNKRQWVAAHLQSVSSICQQYQWLYRS